MAGDWLKVEKSTPEKPEVFAMAASLNLDPDIVFTRLFKMWCWFDANTTDGNARGVTFSLLDRHIGVTGFCNAALQVGWLSVTDDGISLPNFDYHNGQSAKDRSLTAKRVAKHRKSNGKSNGENVTSPLAREEKRREERKEKEAASNDAGAAAPFDFLPANPTEQEAKSFVWRHGPPSLTAANTCTDKNARSMLGEALKKIGAEKTASIVESMVHERPIEPVEYFQASLQRARFVS